jgi:hypothetical protein
MNGVNINARWVLVGKYVGNLTCEGLGLGGNLLLKCILKK